LEFAPLFVSRHWKPAADLLAIGLTKEEKMPSYIIFHPDRQREKVSAKAKVLAENSNDLQMESVEVWIDSRGGCNNEDPWVLSHPWLFSYCHATQLKRSTMGPGDIVFFVSGAAADKGVLRCDTVFVVEQKLEWINGKIPAELAQKYSVGTPEYERHLKFGLQKNKEHTGKFTFTAKKHSKQAERFSFLPLNGDGKNAELQFGDLAKKIKAKRKGKYPVELTVDEAKSLYEKISAALKKRVVAIIQVLPEEPATPRGGCKTTC